MDTLLAPNDNGTSLSKQIRSYDPCFGEFLQSGHNGQKHVQAILLREAFLRFNQQGVGIQQDAPTRILDVSCGPGEYSTAWTTSIARFLPRGMQFFCTDFPGGACADGEKYTTATARKIREAEKAEKLSLSGDPVGVEANLFSGSEAIMPESQKAHIIHWSHSGYHVRDALGDKKDDASAIEAGLNTAIDKMWAALDEKGLLFSVHQTRDISDGVPSEMFPIARKYLGVLDDVPERIAMRVKELGGHVATVNFATPLEFPNMPDGRWEALKDPAKWDYLDANQARVLRLLGFIAYDYSDPTKSGLEKLAEAGTLSAFVDDYKALVKKNGGHISVKCAFQMISKSEEVAHKLDIIADQLRHHMPRYLNEMNLAMYRAKPPGTRLFAATGITHDTFDTERFVQIANAHIDREYAKGRRVGDSFFHALGVFLSQTNIAQTNGGPFGAVIVEFEGGLDAEGKGIGKPRIIGVGANHVVPNNDPSAHAEMEAYRDAARRKGCSDLGGAVLYTSCECCPMCLSVANGCGISKISYVNTRAQAEAIEFSDKLQYDMFALPREQQMTALSKLDGGKQDNIRCKLGDHGAVVLDDKGEVFTCGDTDTSNDPTGIASINAVRSAVKKHADQQATHGANGQPIFCLPDGFTLVCRDIPHPAGLITADWARMLRSRDAAHADNPAFDSKTPDPARIIHVTDEYEQLPVMNGRGQHIHQDATVTYQQPTLPDNERTVRTEQFTGRVVPGVAQEVFDSWKQGTSAGAQVRY